MSMKSTDMFIWTTQKMFDQTFSLTIFKRCRSPWGRGCIKQLKAVEEKRGFSTRYQAQKWARQHCAARNRSADLIRKMLEPPVGK